MNKIDIFLLVVGGIGAWKGYKSGLLMAFFSLTSIILGVFLGFKLMGEGLIFLESKFNIDKSILPYVSFLLIFIAVVVLVRFFGKFIRDFISSTVFGSVDKIFGALLGALKYFFILSVLLWIFESIEIHPPQHLTENSILYIFTVQLAPSIANWSSHLIPIFQNLFSKT